MSLVKCKTWPNVLPDDNGIRPAGDPDKCFYCGQKVGQPHRRECVCVMSRTRYGVYAKGARVGTYRREDPLAWTIHDREFHKNESSWCADNAMDEIEWTTETDRQIVESEIGEGCACHVLEFRVEEIEDAGPLVQIRERYMSN